MTKPGDFIMTTDYATIKQSDKITGSLSIPSTSVGAGSIWETHKDFTIQSGLTIERGLIHPSTIGKWFATTLLGVNKESSGMPYTLFIQTTKAADTTLRLQAMIMNPYDVAIMSQAETIEFRVDIFISPFQD